MKYFLFYVVAALFLLSCGNAEQQKEEQLYQEVIDIHDEVMPRMDDVMQMEKELDENIEQLQQTDTTADQQPRIEYLTTLKQNLSEADEAMMNWMRKFDNEMDGMTHEAKMDYLQQEKQKIQEVKEQINTAIQNAREAVD